MGFRGIALALAACVCASPVAAQTFSFEFAFPFAGLPEIPGSELLASNDFVTTEVTVYSPTRLSLYRLRQTESDNLLPSFLPPGTDVDLVIGENRFEIDDRAFDLTGDLLGTFWFSGGMKNNLGLTFDDGGEVTLYYPDMPFEFYIDGTATYDGIGPFCRPFRRDLFHDAWRHRPVSPPGGRARTRELGAVDRRNRDRRWRDPQTFGARTQSRGRARRLKRRLGSGHAPLILAPCRATCRLDSGGSDGRA
jgi:hypothetical protein